MALIDSSALPQIDIAAEQARARTQISDSLNAGLREICLRFDSIFTAVWRDPKLTPQQVFDALGEDAASLFLFAGAIQGAVNTIAPGALPQVPPTAFTLHENGTVSVM